MKQFGKYAYSTRVQTPNHSSADCAPQLYDAATLKLPPGRRVGADTLRNPQRPKEETQKNQKNINTYTNGQKLRKSNPIKSAKKPLRIATWNVRTLIGASKLDELCSTVKDYKLDAIAVTATHLLDKFESKINGYTFFNSGENSFKRNGVGLLLSPLLADNMASLEQHNSRLLSARIYTRHANLSIVCGYAPTNEATDGAKDSFYKELDRILNIIPKHDVIILLGDFNAQLSNNKYGFEGILGQHSIHTETTDNGERFLELCLSHDLTIGSTIFPHKDIHKYTWNHPNGTVRNQIDHICISRTWRKSLLDVRNQRGANIGSDHELVLAKVQIKLCSSRRQKPTKRFNTNLLQDSEYTTRYQVEICNRFDVLPRDENLDINERWERVSNVIKSSAETSIGFKKPVKDRWLAVETRDLMGKRGEAGKHRK